MSYEKEFIQQIIEGAILAAGEPLSLERIIGLFEEHEMPEKDVVKEALEGLQHQCEGRGYRLVEVASGWRFQVREDLASWVNRLWEEKPQKYSRALLETIALIAYRQPITRGDIEQVRGVAVSSHIIKTLAERDWIKVVGHRDVPGRPALYATTRQFLDYFNLKSLDQLPTLGELRDIDSLNGDLAFGEDEAPDSIVTDTAAIDKAVIDNDLMDSDLIDSDLIDDAVNESVTGDGEAETEGKAEAQVNTENDSERGSLPIFEIDGNDIESSDIQNREFESTEFESTEFESTEYESDEIDDEKFENDNMEINDGDQMTIGIVTEVEDGFDPKELAEDADEAYECIAENETTTERDDTKNYD